MRTGMGVAFYPFISKSNLLLAGVTIPGMTGLAGENDSDLLAHVVCDAVLGAAGLGGMRQQFDENDKKYQDISGLKLLELVRIKLEKLSLEVINLDIILVAQNLDLTSLRTVITVNLQHALNLENGSVSIKTAPSLYPLIAKVEDGIAAMASCSVTEVYELESEEYEEEDDEEGYYE